MMMTPRIDLLEEGVDLELVEDGVDAGQQQYAADGADDAAAPAGQGGAAEHHRGDRLQVVEALGADPGAPEPSRLAR